MTKKKIRASKMRAAIFHGPKDLRLEVVDIPSPQAGEILVKVGTSLTCGTDFKAYRQGHPVLLNHRLPSPFGHECAGTVAELGAGVKNFKEGERVVIANSAPCDQCFYCKNETPNLCDHLQLLNGAYAEYLLVPKQIVKHNLHILPEKLAFPVAALTEPFACVVRAFEKMALKKGETLAILGCGLMGLFFTALAKHQGVRVIAIGRSAEKLEQAKMFGADEVVSTVGNTDFLANVLSLTPEKRGADAVVEAIGTPETWGEAVRLVRKGGQVCLYGGCAKGSNFSLDTHRVHYQELKIFGVFHHTPKHFAQALALLAQGFMRTEFLIAGEITLAQIPEHFASQVGKPFHKVAVLP